MIKFLLKGLIRDRARSLFPFLTVSIGVTLTVFLYSWVGGIETDMTASAAAFSTGHVKVMSRAYAEEADQVPLDLAYIGVASLLDDLESEYPDMIWLPRIRFGGLLDIPDERGETRAQAPAAGMAVRLLNPQSPEKQILNLEESLTAGRLPQEPGEILISREFSRQLGVEIGDTATLITTTMYGGMATANFTISGLVSFGVAAMDRRALIADINDIQYALNMEDAAGEIMGYFPDMVYKAEPARETALSFNRNYNGVVDEFAPAMVTLHDQAGMSGLLDYFSSFAFIILFLFISVMSLVLWNAGLIGSLRRYREIGVRLAIGEEKGHLYRTLIGESLLIGFFGSITGTLFGLMISYYLQNHGIDISSMMQDVTMMMNTVVRARVTWGSYVVGFVPGLLATFIGTAIAGIGIYKRSTSRLMKELEE